MKTEDIVVMRAKLEKATKLSDEIERLVQARNRLQNAKTVLIESNYNGAVHSVHCATQTMGDATVVPGLSKLDYRLFEAEVIKDVMKEVKHRLGVKYDEVIASLQNELEAL